MSRSLRTTLLLGGILLLAFAIRAIDLNGQSLFVDEFSEITLAKKPVAQIIPAADSAPPLFPLALKTWMAAWHSDASARWFSVACGVASVLCVWGIGRRLVDDATGLAAALVTAILPMHVFYSQFVRCYSLMFLLVALDLWLLLRALDLDRPRDWIAFAVVAVLGAYTHYYFVIFLAVSVLVACRSRRHWWIGRRAFAAYAAIGIAMLPLLWLLPADLEFQKGLRDPRPLTAATLGYTYFSIFNGYTLGPSTDELQSMTAGQAIRAAAPWILAVGFVLLILGYEGWKRLRIERSVVIIAAIATVPVLILGILSIAGGLNYNVRFVTWIMIAAAVWLGAGIAAGRHRRIGSICICRSRTVIRHRLLQRPLGRAVRTRRPPWCRQLLTRTRQQQRYGLRRIRLPGRSHAILPRRPMARRRTPGSRQCQLRRARQSRCYPSRGLGRRFRRPSSLAHLQPPLPRRSARPASQDS